MDVESISLHTMRDDLEADRMEFYPLVLAVTLIVALVIVVAPLTTRVEMSLSYLEVWLPLAVGISVGYLTYRLGFATWGARLYVAGLALTIAMTTARQLPEPPQYLWLVLPIAIATFLLEHGELEWVTPFTVFSALGFAVVETNFFVAVPHLIFPALICLVLTAASYGRSWNMYKRLEWALDLQGKDTRRAEMFYDQSEMLQQALLQVQHYSARLESVNTQLAEAQARAERISNAKSIFLSNMSHELRTPLNVIIGYSNAMLNMPRMFKNTNLPKVYHPYVQQIEENGHYLVGLVNDILDLSKIEAGRLELHCSTVDVEDMFRGVVATGIGLIKAKPVQMRTEYPEDLPKIWADPLRLRQIILNLLSNAAKFTETGSITLSARLEDDMIYIAVADTGKGIPADVLPVIFDRFEQGEKDTERKFGGTGLGLDISKQLSLMHGGDLTVESQFGRGSTFTIRLPLVPIDELSEDRSFDFDGGIHVFDTTEVEAVSPPMVLVIEHDGGLRNQMRQTLEGADYVVVSTHSASDAIEMAQGLLPSLIVVASDLPDMNGIDLVQQLRADPEMQSMPVVMCVANGDGERAAGLPLTLAIHKPISPEQLLEVAQAALSQPVVIEV